MALLQASKKHAKNDTVASMPTGGDFPRPGGGNLPLSAWMLVPQKRSDLDSFFDCIGQTQSRQEEIPEFDCCLWISLTNAVIPDRIW